MIKTVFFFSVFGISLFFSILFAFVHLILGAVGLKKLQKTFLIRITRGWARFMISVTGNKIRVENQELVPDGPVLFVANHQSYFDIPVMMAYTPHFAPFIAKVELEKVAMLSFWMRQMGCLFMDRKNMRQSLQIILDGIEMLKKGESLVIFPEGTRSHDGHIMDFKPGSLKLAVKANVPIVPVTLVNTYKVFEENKRVRKADVSVIFHEAIDTASLTREEVNQLHTLVKERIQSRLER